MSIADDIKVYHNPADDLSEKTGDELVEGVNMTAGEVNERIRGRIDIEAYRVLLEKAQERALNPPIVYDGRGQYDKEASDQLADQAHDHRRQIEERLYGRPGTLVSRDTVDLLEDTAEPMPVSYVETDHTINGIRTFSAGSTDVADYLAEVARIIEGYMGMPAHTLTLVEKKKPRSFSDMLYADDTDWAERKLFDDVTRVEKD